MLKYSLKLFLLIVATSFVLSCKQESNSKNNFEINKDWLFKELGDSIWLQATVPGCVHTDLLNNNIIEDPFYRLNEHDIQWIDKKAWEYQTSFNVNKKTLEKDVVELIFNGLDTYSNIYLNDKLLLQTDNMFISWEVNCKDYLKAGDNKLRIVFKSPIRIGLDKKQNNGYQLPGAENDQSELGGIGDNKTCVFSRKAQYQFGWDWGPRLVTSGIWKTIELKAWNYVKFTDVHIIQKKVSKTEASILSNLQIESVSDTKIEIVCILDSIEISNQIYSVKKGINKLSIPISLSDPKLWWTNGLGEQNLYNIKFNIYKDDKLLASNSKNIGLRTVKIIQELDSIGKSFYVELNGHPVFMKGANYIPQDIFLSRVKDEDYKRLIKSAAEANYNMLRVWGGGVYEREIFYDLCDEYGILVWQDFMFACAMYPGNKEFLNNVRKEARFNVKRLRNHPCIALWCGDNEILSAWNRWGWKENVLENQGKNIVDTVWKAYEDVFHNILPDVVKELDPDKLYWSSSPSSDFGKLENGKSGDNHYWGVWWAKEPFSQYTEEIPRFMSEFGFQSFPEFKSVKKYTNKGDWDIYSDVMKSHQRSSIGNVTIEEYMLRDYKRPKDFESFLYVGQLLQARGIKIGIEAHRRSMPYCMGSLYWQLNDCWPVASWSSIDYYGNWKALHYTVRNSFKATKLSFQEKDDKLNVYIISDDQKDINASLEFSVIDFKGNIHYTKKKTIIIKANKSKIYLCESLNDMIKEYNRNDILVNAVIKNQSGEIIDNSIHYLTLPKELNLPKPNISYTIEKITDSSFELNLSTDVLAKNIYIKCPYEGHFSDNYFDLLPLNKKRIIFNLHDKIDVNELRKKTSILCLTDSY